MARTIPGVSLPQGVSAAARPPLPPRGVQRPTGARRYRVGTNVAILSGWALGPPDDFLTGNNSFEEWPVWWALEQELGPPGTGSWTYQIKIAAQLPGGHKPDFLVFQKPPLIIRVQSDRYHLSRGGWLVAYDLEQRIQLERIGYRVIDVYPQHYMHDPTFSVAVLRVVRDALNGVQRPNPATTATSIARA